MNFVAAVVSRVALWQRFGREVHNRFALLRTDLVKLEKRTVVTVRNQEVDSWHILACRLLIYVEVVFVVLAVAVAVVAVAAVDHMSAGSGC